MASANYNLKLDTNWKFHLGELPRKSEIPINLAHKTSKTGGALDELDFLGECVCWTPIDLPHDWLTDLTPDPKAYAAGGFKARETAWYTLPFHLPADSIESAKLIFEGVLGNCIVYVNGVEAARNFSGYNRFDIQIEDYLLPNAENRIALYVDARRWEGWWYEGAGLYRPVRIEFRPFTHFSKKDCFITTEKNETNWKIHHQLAISGNQDHTAVSFAIKDADGKIIDQRTTQNIDRFETTLENPKLWAPEHPYLYTAEYTLLRDSLPIDHFTAKIGLRSIEWNTDQGMLLNGTPYSIHGICNHQDHAGVGAAMPKELTEYRIQLLKDLGINAYRCAHHAPSEDLLEICDRLGMLVMVENRHFTVAEETLKQLDALVLLSRNHASVFLYSLFNEEPWQAESRGKRIAEKLRNRILQLDSTRAITGAQNGGLLEKSNASDSLDVIGINYFLADYDKAHHRTPNKVLIGTENCPTYATRGVYTSDPKKQIFACYGDEWGDFSESLEETMNAVYSRPFSAGCFAWCGSDHRGEPTPYGWPSLCSHWGFSDQCGFYKDTAYLLATWYKKELFAHLLPHWNWEKGKKIRVCTFTNGTDAELFLNGRSLGKKEVFNRRAEWKVPFEEGILRIEVSRGCETACAEIQTAQKTERLQIEDISYGTDIHILNLSAVDANGIFSATCCKKILLQCKNATILGIGNGDPNDHTPEKNNSIHLFNGKAQVILRSKSGKIDIFCEDLEPQTISFKEKSE